MYKLLLIVGFICIPLEIILYMPFKWAVWGLKSTNYHWDDRWYGLDIKLNREALMKDYDILIQKGYKYIKFKDTNEFNKYGYLSMGRWFDEDGYYEIKDSKYSQWDSDDGEGKTIEASQIEEELNLNLDWVLKIMETIDE